VELAIPDEVWARATSLLPPAVGWDAIPAGKVSLDEGDRWLKANTSALLVVPSVIVSEERNVLINPLHPDTARIAAHKIRKWTYDPRLMRSGLGR
jgi:RES domain-containing protein